MPQFNQFEEGFDPSTVIGPNVDIEMTRPFPGNKNDESLAERLSDLGGAGWHNRPWLDTDVKHADEPVVQMLDGLPLELTQTPSYPPQAQPRSPSGTHSPLKCDSCGLNRHFSHDRPAPCICGHKCIDLAESTFCPDIEVPMSDYPSRDYQVLPESHQQPSPTIPYTRSSGQHSPLLRRHSSLCSPPLNAYEEAPELPTTNMAMFTAEPEDESTPSNSMPTTPLTPSLEHQRLDRERRGSMRQQQRLEQARHEVLFGNAKVDNIYAHDATEQLREREQTTNTTTTTTSTSTTELEGESTSYPSNSNSMSNSIPTIDSLEAQRQDRERRSSIRQQHLLEKARREVLFGGATMNNVYAHDATVHKPVAELPVTVLPHVQQQQGENYFVAEEPESSPSVTAPAEDVPEVVKESLAAAHQSAEAAGDETMVEEKKEMEEELLMEVEREEGSGEPVDDDEEEEEDDEEEYSEGDEDRMPNCDGPEDDDFPRWMDRSRFC